MIKSHWQGMRLSIHPLLWLVACSAVWTGYFIELFTLFVLIIIHELGHVSAAKAYGWRVISIELFPFGGVAQTEEWGTVSAKEEIVVALAGPFQHVFMVLISFLFFAAGWWKRDWMEYFIQGNIMIACFNLLPVYPLDGGRVLQAVLSLFFPYRFCIDLTLWMGVAFSFFLGLSSLFCFRQGMILHLLLIALFLFYSNVIALKQKNYQFLRFLLSRSRRQEGDCPVKKITVNESALLKKVVRRLYKEKYHILEVIDGQGKVIGFLPEEAVLDQFLHTRFRFRRIRELFG